MAEYADSVPTDACAASGRKQHDAAALAHGRQQLLHEKVRGADVHGEQVVEVLDCRVLDRRRLADAGVGDEDVEAPADDRPHLASQFMRAVRLAQVRRDLLGAAARFADLGDDRGRLLFAAAVVNQDLRTGFREGQRTGTADTARSAVTSAVFPERLLFMMKFLVQNGSGSPKTRSARRPARCGDEASLTLRRTGSGTSCARTWLAPV